RLSFADGEGKPSARTYDKYLLQVALSTTSLTPPASASPATPSSTPPTPSPAATSAPSSATVASPSPLPSRCLDDRLSLCQSCYRAGPDAGGCGPGHRHHPLSRYSGCPSPPELSAMWSSMLDLSDKTPPQEGGLDKMAIMTIDQNCASKCCGAGEAVSSGILGGQENSVAKFDPWVAVASSPSMAPPESNAVPPCGPEQQGFFHRECNLPKMGFPALTDLGICYDNELCQGFSTGIACFNFHDGAELLGGPQNRPKNPFPDTGLDGFVVGKNLSVAESSGHIESTVEATNAGQIVNSNVDPSFINVDNKRSGNFIFHIGNVCPTISLSLSNLTGESSAADYQDRGVSPTFLTGESTWDSNLEPGRPHVRNEAKTRYNEKKKSRLFGKQIRYGSRKARADTRKRLKGRFVKADETYDYDPLIAGNT
ncbi:zinc finger protein, partial [Musa troglodytarum]